MKMSGDPYTSQEIESLTEMYRQGCPLQEIAKTLHRSYFGIRSKVLTLKLSGKVRLWTAEDTERLRVYMVNQGLLPKQIAPLMQRHEQHLRDKARENGFSTLAINNKLRASGLKRCPQCKQVYPLNTCVGRYCPACHRNRQNALRYRDLVGYLSVMLGPMKARARKKGMAFTLTRKEIEGLFEAQAGLCYYSGKTMTWQRSDGPMRRVPSNLSVDRLDSDHGYTLDNVVLCCAQVNTMKSDLPEGEFIDWCHIIAKRSAK